MSVQGGNSIDRAATAAKGLGTSIDQANAKVKAVDSSMGAAGRQGSAAFDSVSSSVRNMVAGLGAAAFTMSSLGANAQMTGMENSIKFAGGAEGASNLAYVRSEVEALRLPLMESMDGWKTLSGSVMGTNITTAQTRDIFRSTAEAATVMGLSAEMTNGAFLALGQMASKGTVPAEELRGQLGERIPGAFNIAARAMGVTTMELGKMMEKGELASDVFLPKFAAEMHRTFGPGLTAALDGPQQQFNRFNNAVLESKRLLGEVLMPTVTALINDGFLPLTGFIRDNSTAIIQYGSVLAIGYGALKTYTFWTGMASAATTAFAWSQLFLTGSMGRSLAIGMLTNSIMGLNAAMWANPAMMIAGGIIAVGAAVVYAWNHFEGFRSFLYGTFEVMKSLGNTLYDMLVRPFLTIGNVLKAVFTGDFAALKTAMNDYKQTAYSWMTLGANDAVKAWGVGKEKGVASFDADNPEAKGAFFDYNKMGRGFGAKANDVFGGAASTTGDGASGGKSGKKSASSGLSGMGSQNVSHVTINLDNLIERLEIHSVSVKESTAEIREVLTRELLQIINSANQITH